MSPRSLRRAAERKAFKDARKNAPITELLEYSEPARPAPAISEARLAANAANAQLSTGPRTSEGKAKSSVNAVKTALTGRTVLLPTDDVAAYRKHVQIFTDEFQPVGPHESELVQALADHGWRLDRIASLEMAIYAYGHEQFAEQFADRGPLQSGLTQMHTFLHYEKQLRNLQMQEMRIRRNREKDTAELRRLQNERIDRAPSVSDPVTRSIVTPKVGFDFSSVREYAQTVPHAPGLPCTNVPQVSAERV
jgi:hypothetical protein